MKKTQLTLALITLASLTLPAGVMAQGGPPNFGEREKQALAEKFVGVQTDQGIEKGLFPIQSTGVSTAPIAKAGKAFLNGLTKEQRTKTQFDIQDQEWRKWSNVDNGIYKRQGISIKEMTQAQRKLAFSLMQEALSAKGLQLSKDIMKTDQTLKEFNNNSANFDEELYFFTIMGNPSTTEPWGWQLDGHHLVINYFVIGDQVVMSPVFMGAEPVITTTGKYKGNTLFQDEQNQGLAFMQSLSAANQKKAILSNTKSRGNIVAGAMSDNKTVNYAGVKATDLSKKQQAALLDLTAQYINNMREGHAEVKLSDIQKHWDKTYFAWVGGTGKDDTFYYRIHSPVVLIEFDHQSPVGVRGAGRGAPPTKNHIHTMVRTPNGNDYGKDYLKQHLEKDHAGDSSSSTSDSKHSHKGDHTH